ncbi:unnamed protein product [Schistocephalus solidus]|uniref:Uncharacterized protein n=1 Tax=Schistocephalus solidus TaxID=70667 RepID=A0A183T417_SCHSO|nr:unnamed protein product [Schistocephalus solidus]
MALVTRELARYKVDIAALSETRFSEQDQLDEVVTGYTFFWSGRPKAERRDAGVSFAIRNDIVGRLPCLSQVINDHLVSLHLPLQGDKFVTIISAYAAPLQDEVSSAITQKTPRQASTSNELANRLFNLPITDTDISVENRWCQLPIPTPSNPHTLMSSAAHVLSTKTSSMKTTQLSTLCSSRRTSCTKPTYIALPLQTKQLSSETAAVYSNGCGRCRIPG